MKRKRGATQALVARLKGQGVSMAQIAQRLGVSLSIVYRHARAVKEAA